MLSGALRLILPFLLQCNVNVPVWMFVSFMISARRDESKVCAVCSGSWSARFFTSTLMSSVLMLVISCEGVRSGSSNVFIMKNSAWLFMVSNEAEQMF